MARNLSLIFVALAFAFVLASALTPSDIKIMEKAIIKYFGFVPQYAAPCNPCKQGDNIGALVRLVFHDTFGGGGYENKGGMNACIDFKTMANNGLQEVISQLDEIYPKFSGKISKADFWLLAANTAVKFATTPTTGPTYPGMDKPPYTLNLPFRFGRVDDATCSDKGLLPDINFNWTQMTDMFINRIGLDVPQFVALIGAHSLGRAQKKNSGVEGGWTLTQSSLTNGFFQSLGDVKWTEDAEGDVWVNNDSNPPTIMLRVDVEPLYSPATNCPSFINFTQSGSCRYNYQSNDPSAHFLYYANNITAFFGNFSQAWEILSEYNYNVASVNELKSL